MHHHAQLIFVFLIEMGFHLIDQDGLELLTTLASQSAGIRREAPERDKVLLCCTDWSTLIRS